MFEKLRAKSAACHSYDVFVLPVATPILRDADLTHVIYRFSTSCTDGLFHFRVLQISNLLILFISCILRVSYIVFL